MPNILLNKVNTDTTGTPARTDGAAKTIVVDAIDFGGGNVTIEVSRASDNSEPWVIPDRTDGTPAVYYAGKVELINFLAAGLYIRASLAGSSGANSVNCAIF
jgi:hypothetical protein